MSTCACRATRLGIRLQRAGDWPQRTSTGTNRAPRRCGALYPRGRCRASRRLAEVHPSLDCPAHGHRCHQPDTQRHHFTGGAAALSACVQLQGSAAGGRIEIRSGFWICVNKDTLTPSRSLMTASHASAAPPKPPARVAPMAHWPNIDGTETPFLRRTDIDPFEHVITIYWAR